MNLKDTIAELRKLNEPVPTPVSLPSKEEIDELEADLEIKFPADFRTYLLLASDVAFGTIEPVVITDEEAHTDFRTVLADARDAGLPDGLIPLCEENGDYHCMKADGTLVFWSADGENEETWPDLAAWISEVWMES
jgi:hypothetical protein